MGTVTLDRREHWLREHARNWVDAGLISDTQADLIARYERVAASPPSHAARLTIASEVAAYVGSLLALMGGVLVVGRTWESIVFPVRLGIGIAIAVVGFAAGTALVRIGEAGTCRLGSYLWMIGTGGLALTIGVAADTIDPADEAWIALNIGVVTIAVGLALWRNLARPLQVVTAAIGYAVTLAGLMELTGAPAWTSGVATMSIGGAVAAGAMRGRLLPHDTVLATGALALFLGAFVLGDLNRHLGPAIATVVAAGVVALALRERLVPLLVGGVLGLLVAVQALLTTSFSGAVSASVVSALGMAVLVLAVLRTRPAG